jgi:hypothetical protein
MTVAGDRGARDHGDRAAGDTLWLTPRGVGYARTSTDLSDWRKANTGLPSVTVDRLASDGRSVYALCLGNIYRWETATSEWIPIGFIGNVFNLEDRYGTVLVSTSSGIWRHRAEDLLFGQIADSPAADGTPGNDNDPAVDPTGSATHFAGGVFNGTAGIWEQPAGGGPWRFHMPPGPPGNIYANIIVESRVYAATRNEGIGRWDGSAWSNWDHVNCGVTCTDTFKYPDEVFALVADKSGKKWVGCWGYALDRFDDGSDPDVFEHLWGSSGEDIRHTYANGAALDSSGVENGVFNGVGNGGVWFGMDSPGGVPIGLDYYDSTGAYIGTWGPTDPQRSRAGEDPGGHGGQDRAGLDRLRRIGGVQRRGSLRAPAHRGL